MTAPDEAVGWMFDSMHMGRSSIDLYSNDVGVPFEQIRGFAAYVGGSPTNVSVGARRLGLRTALLTGLGDDPVADLILRFLEENGVEVSCSPRKPGHRTSAVLLGIEPPDRFFSSSTGTTVPTSSSRSMMSLLPRSMPAGYSSSRGRI